MVFKILKYIVEVLRPHLLDKCFFFICKLKNASTLSILAVHLLTGVVVRTFACIAVFVTPVSQTSATFYWSFATNLCPLSVRNAFGGHSLCLLGIPLDIPITAWITDKVLFVFFPFLQMPGQQHLITSSWHGPHAVSLSARPEVGFRVYGKSAAFCAMQFRVWRPSVASLLFHGQHTICFLCFLRQDQCSRMFVVPQQVDGVKKIWPRITFLQMSLTDDTVLLPSTHLSCSSPPVSLLSR